MIYIEIGEAKREFGDVDEQWLQEQINRRRSDGRSVCVRVTIREGELDLLLSTPTCVGGSGGGRLPRPHEQAIIDLWEERGLNDPEFTGGNLVAFLKQLKRLL